MAAKMIIGRRFLFRPPIPVKITRILQKTPEFQKNDHNDFPVRINFGFFWCRTEEGGYERGGERKEKREERRRCGLRCNVLSRAVLSCAVSNYIYIYAVRRL